MFVPFFYKLRERGVPVTPTAFLRLQSALGLALITSLDDFYSVARSLLVKRERDFDTYDQVFAEHFAGAKIEENDGVVIDDIMRALLDEWLKDPSDLAKAMRLTTEQLRRMSVEELKRYFHDRLQDQDGAHHGGKHWIGTGGVSPVGHGGNRPGGMRVGGFSQNQSAIKTALERRYKDYSRTAPLTGALMGEALKSLRHLMPAGSKDIVNVDKTIYQTMRNAGEIEIIFDRRLTDKLKVVLMIDNGGWSMDSYIDTVQALFHNAQAQFRELSIFYFHNTVRDRVWRDPQRRNQPETIESLISRDPETRLILVGDASMAPEELFGINGRTPLEYRQKLASIDRLKQLAGVFRHAVWLNPQSVSSWNYSGTSRSIQKIFPMYPLNLLGLENAMVHLTRRQ